MATVANDDPLDVAMGEGGLHAVYQPVVELETGHVLGYEALARGPAGSPVEAPEPLFDAAREAGRTAELDWRCRGAALGGALAAELRSTLTLFVNVEPDTTAESLPFGLEDVVAQAERSLRVVVEVTEAAVVERPAELLEVIDWARDRSWGVALDDLGANPDSLAMMPFLEPDVIKLDLRLVQEQPSPAVGSIVSAVLAQSERTGAAVVAEGIETEEHRRIALALGATHGQGWLFGRPAGLPEPLPEPTDAIPLVRRVASSAEMTPFTVVRSARPLRRGDRALLTQIAGHLEEQVLAWEDHPVILAAYQRSDVIPPLSLDRYSALVQQGSYVVVLGANIAAEPRPGVTGSALPAGHRLADECSVVVVGPHYAGALVARHFGDDQYDYAVTHDRALVVDAGRALLRQVESPVRT